MNPWEVAAFRRFLAMRACSVVAAQIQLAALAWWVWHETGQALDFALVGLAQFLPVLLFALPAGQVADRFDRRAILRTCQLAQGVLQGVLCALAWVGSPSTATLFAIGVAIGTVRAFGAPASQALIGNLVPAEALPRAFGMSATVFQLGTVVGPSVCGQLLFAESAVPAFATSAVLLALAAMLAHGLPEVRVRGAETSVASLVAGLRYVVENRTILACTTLDLFAVLLGGATALLAPFADEVLHVGPRGFGVLRAAPAIGATVVALWFARFPTRPGAGGTMLAAVAVYGLGTLVFGLSTSFPVCVAALVVLGGADMVSVVIRQSLVQIQTPDAMRGRVSAVNQVFISASNELGEFESGLVMAALGPARAVVFGALGTLAVVASWTALFPELRRARLPGEQR